MLQNFHDQARLSVCLKELQSLIGLLNFTCLVVARGRAFLRRMIEFYQRRQQDLLTFYLQRLSLPLFALLQPYISIVISGKSPRATFMSR